MSVAQRTHDGLSFQGMALMLCPQMGPFLLTRMGGSPGVTVTEDIPTFALGLLTMGAQPSLTGKVPAMQVLCVLCGQ